MIAFNSRGTALVVPSNSLTPEGAGTYGRDTELVERRAVEAVLAAERALGRVPEEMPRNNPGYDIRSTGRDGFIRYVEVKGRIAGAETFTVTTNEVTFAQTQGMRHRLALVEVSSDEPDNDRLRYVSDAFAHLDPSVTTRSYNEDWGDYWNRGVPPR